MGDKIIDALQSLNSFDADTRREGLESFLESEREAKTEKGNAYVNMHCHTFFSYNPDNHSPTMIACKAKRAGLYACGIVDFDVLDGVDEFLLSASRLGIRGTTGIETRVYLEPLADKEINSPGEPGIAYHMGIGMPSSSAPAAQQAFLEGLKETAQSRNRAMIERVNSAMTPLKLDYDKDVIPLTPNGNATERHLCLAYARKAENMFSAKADLRRFWDEKLGGLPETIELPAGFDLQALIRKKFMKSGGVGYAVPDSGSFPTMSDFNQFVLACGGIPSMAWLDGTTAGERDLESLLQIDMEMGTVAVNLIPDRNFTSGVEDEKLKNLNEFIATAERLGLPVLAGTELNAPGLRFVDDFEAPELAPFLPVFLKGAKIVYAHTFLERAAGMGYCSPWGNIHFSDSFERNRFFEEVGENLDPSRAFSIAINKEMEPEQVLKQTKES